MVAEVLSPSTRTSVPTRRVSKWPCDRARVRPQSARAAICRRPVTTNSPNGALSSFPCGGFSSSFCTPCGASTVAVWHCGCRRSSLGRRQTHTDQSLHALLSPLGPATVMERDGGGLSHLLGQGLRRGGTRRHLRAGAPGARPNRCDRRR